MLTNYDIQVLRTTLEESKELVLSDLVKIERTESVSNSFKFN